MSLKNKVQLIVYPNRIGEGLADLYTFLSPLKKNVGGVHILPFYPSNSDGGFSPLTHMQVNPLYGDWQDINQISKDFDVCADVTLNHLSDLSPQFQDFLARGKDSEFYDLFIDVPELYGEFTQGDLRQIHIRKEKEPFLEVTTQNGYTTKVWNTFSQQQIDLNYRSAQVFELMEETMKFLSDQGVKLFRLDAFGYITKEKGTRCFLIEPKIWEYLDWFVDTSRKYNTDILPEVHDHPSFQTKIAERGAYSYGFALPPLVLYAMLFGQAKELKGWLKTCPHNQITVLDTHDGITMPDVEDILSESQQQQIIEELSGRSADPVMRKSAANIHSVGGIYQLTCTFWEALERDENKYLIARLIQLFTPGIPQIYYEGLLAGENNFDLAAECSDPRFINRTRYTLEQASDALNKPVVKKLLKYMEIRNTHPAFDGEFVLRPTEDHIIHMEWKKGSDSISLKVDLSTMEYWVK